MDHATLAVDVLVGEQQAVGPVVEDPEAGIDGRGDFRHRYVVYIINGLVDARIRIQVGAEFHTDALAVFDHAVAREIVSRERQTPNQRSCTSSI